MRLLSTSRNSAVIWWKEEEQVKIIQFSQLHLNFQTSRCPHWVREGSLINSIGWKSSTNAKLKETLLDHIENGLNRESRAFLGNPETMLTAVKDPWDHWWSKENIQLLCRVLQ